MVSAIKARVVRLLSNSDGSAQPDAELVATSLSLLADVSVMEAMCLCIL
ncbi:MAG: hypothetical protein ACI86X_001314 [Moritella sp.]|jgi:hypothetical protein